MSMMLEPPYGVIADLLKEGQVVPFLGAGVNFGKRPSGAAWDERTATFLPSGVELSRFLAGKTGFPSEDEHDRSDLAKVASFYVETNARRPLRRELQRIFNRDYDPCPIHDYLAELPAPLLIVTTNYDDLLEQAFRRASRPYDLVIYPTDRKETAASVLWWRHGDEQPTAVAPNMLYLDLERTSVIYKIHGTVDRRELRYDSYVVTEEDYINFLSRMMGQTAVPALFIRHFRTRHFLFLGYGLRDWNLRLMLKRLRTAVPEGTENSEDEDEELVSWAIQYGPSLLEKELWDARRVKIYDIDINTFVARLRAAGE